MKPRHLVPFLLAALLVAAPSTARADDCYDGCPGLGVAIIGGILALTADAAVGAGGLITLTGGAVDAGTHRYQRGWRIANYVLGALNLAHGIVWGGLSATGGSSLVVTAPLAVTHLAIGGVDLALAISSARHASRMPYALSVRPLAARDSSGNVVPGLSVALVGF